MGKERWQNVFDHAPVGLFRCGRDGRLLAVNRAFAKIFGANDPGQLVGVRLTDSFVDPNEVERWQGQFEVHTQPVVNEWQMRRTDGSPIWVRIRAETVLDEAGDAYCEGIIDEISAQRRAEETLHVSEKKLQLIFEHAFDGISIYEELPDSGSRRLIECNERYAEMAGHSREELYTIGNTSLVQRKVGRIFTRAENLLIRQQMMRYRGFFSWIRPDGRENVIEYSAAPIDVEGRPLTIGIDRDITEQINAQEEAMRRAAHLEAINVVIGAAAAANSILELMEKSAQQLARALLADYLVLWVGEQTTALGMPMERALAWRLRFESESEVAHLLHDVMFEEEPKRRLLVAPIIHEGRRLGGFVISAADVDAWPQDALALADAVGQTVGTAVERLRLLEQTQYQAHQMQMLLDVASDGIVLLDHERRIAMMNPAARRELPALAAAGVGDVLEALGNCQIDELIACQTGADFQEIEQAQAGRVYAVSIVPVNKHDVSKGWMMTLRNITEERDRQQRSEQQGRLAAVGQLAAGIAHDFNNILAVVLLLSQLLEQDAGLTEKAHQRVKAIIHQIDRASGLVRQILDFSRKSLMQPTLGDLALLLADTADLLRRTLPENIRVEVDLADQPFEMEADFTYLKQVLMNLAINAVDAMPSGGVLTFRLDRVSVAPQAMEPSAVLGAGECYRLIVADTGEGIPSNVLPHIFEPFFTTKEVGKGTGLGLAQVHGIIHQHGGAIVAENRADGGAQFSIYLPAPASAVSPVETTLTQPDETNGRTLLLVEDDPTLRSTLCDVLEAYGFTLLPTESGEDALEHIAGRLDQVDLVVSDLSLPGMSGIDLHHHLRSQRPDLRTIILSGYPTERELFDWQQDGIVAWLQKPVSIKELAKCIDVALDNKA